MAGLAKSLAVVWAVLALLWAATPAQADPFRSGKPAPVVETAAPATPSATPAFIADLARMQQRLNAAISGQIRVLKEGGSVAGLAGVLGLSFLFGALHAAGPGHGKMVVASYFIANRERWLSGALVGGSISLVQGVSAVLMVGILGIVLKLGHFSVMGHTAIVEVVSYGLITLIGLWMFVRAVLGKGCASHDHGHGHGHHEGECCGHHGGEPQGDGGVRLGLVLAAGLTPCASAIIVMLFALANDVFAIGVAAAMAMSVGMGVTVSAIGILTILARQTMQRLMGGDSSRAQWVERGLALAGALAVTAFAGALGLAAWTRL